MVSKTNKFEAEATLPKVADDNEEFEGDYLGEFEGELDGLSLDE